HTINGWVADQTAQRIPELIAQGVLDGMTRLTLVNAVYLKAAWRQPFYEGATKDAPFNRADGSIVDVPLMALSERLRYGKGDGWQAVELPYVGGSLAMTIVVPDRGALATFEQGFDLATIENVVAALSPRQVDLRLPKFDVEQSLQLNDALVALGMPDAFDPDRADFSPMLGTEKLYISDVIHQANMTVDEKGTEAAAATAIVMRATSAPIDPVQLTVDRPFLVLLRDLPTGAILFAGRIADPSA
ncbi:MAG TPA: serpin family protein, partial [Acidimicrobiales bacterium]